MMYATISADIIASSTLEREEMIGLHQSINECLKLLECKYSGFWGRIVRGDTIECVMDCPEDALEIALVLKTWVKAYGLKCKKASASFGKYGLRLAIGIGELKIADRQLDIIDGDAIYRSGRCLDGLKGWSKYAMTISLNDDALESALVVMMMLANQNLNRATSRKCETICQRILAGDSQKSAEKMGISVSGVNQTLNDVGWSAIERMIAYYRKNIVVL